MDDMTEDIEGSNPIRLGAILQIFLRRWRIIALCAAAGIAVGLIWIVVATPVYVATAVILLDDKGTDLDILMGGLRGTTSKVPAERGKILLTTRSLLESVVKRLKLDYEIATDPMALPVSFETVLIGDEWIDRDIRIQIARKGMKVSMAHKGAIGEGQVNETFRADGIQLRVKSEVQDAVGIVTVRRKRLDEAVEDLLDEIQVRELGQKSGVLSISVRNPDPEVARKIIETLTNTYISSAVGNLGQEATQTMAFLANQLELVRASLENAEQELNRYKREKGVFLLQSEAETLIGEISRASMRTSDLSIRRRQLEVLKQGMKEGEVSRFLLADLMEDETLLVLAKLVSALSEQLIDLRTFRMEYGDEDSKVLILRAAIDENMSRITNVVDNAISSVDVRLTEMKKQRRRLEERMRDLPDTEQKLSALTRNAKVNGELYTYIMKSYEEARLRRAAVVSNAVIVDPAATDPTPVYPRKALIMLLAMLLGLTLGGVLAMIAEVVFDEIVDGEEIERLYGQSIVSAFPEVSPGADDALNDPLKIAESKGLMAEAARLLRTHVQFSSRGKAHWRLMIASPRSAEGKSTLMASLAVTLASTGEPTAIIDCDLRLPRLHRYFGIENRKGIVDLVNGEATLDEVRHQLMPNLDIVTGGSPTSFPSELLSSNVFREFLDRGFSRYRYVLIDTPAGMGFSDPMIVAPLVNSVYIAVRPRYSRRKELQRFLEQLQTVQASITGVILNRVRLSGVGYGYGYGYGATQADDVEAFRAGAIEGWRSAIARAVDWLAR